VYFGFQPNCDFALLVSITTDARATCSHSRADGVNGTCAMTAQRRDDVRDADLAVEDLYAGWWQHLSTLGATPRVSVWDGDAAVGRWRARQPELTAQCQAFRGTLAAKVLICKPG
jgi:hypothetical protein